MNILEVAGGKPIKLWTDGVPVDEGAREQLLNTAKMPFIFKHLAVMPDVHLGKGSTIGSVIPTLGAIIPAAVGVDIGCGMIAARTSLSASDLPDNLHGLRSAIEKAVPTARPSAAVTRAPGTACRPWPTVPGMTWRRASRRSPTSTRSLRKPTTASTWAPSAAAIISSRFAWMKPTASGSCCTAFTRVGNAIGNLFIELAQADMRQHIANLSDRNLAYFEEGSRHFADYVEAVEWAQDFARQNRALMMHAVIAATRKVLGKPFEANLEAVNCHHNYVQREHHFGHDVLVTRKGAVSAQKGELGIIPGSMGAKSFIVRGLGNEEAFCSCSHGAGRVMSRTRAKQAFTVEDQRRATAHVECRKDKDVIDEIPMAYKDIDAVMQAQRELVEVVHTLRQVVCVKG